MAAQEAYVLSYRRDDTEEDERLDWQHELIKHLIWDGQLIQKSIPLRTLINDHSKIADVGCGTGIWLKEVGDVLFSAGIQETGVKKHTYLLAQDIDTMIYQCLVNMFLFLS
jgi:hypothetical protein